MPSLIHFLHWIGVKTPDAFGLQKVESDERTTDVAYSTRFELQQKKNGITTTSHKMTLTILIQDFTSSPKGHGH